MEIFQKTEFKKSYKKLHQNQRAAVNEEIKKIIANPNIGVEKVGDLKGVFVHKFNIFNQQYLLAYVFDEKTMTLIMLGVHENFYISVKNILK
ncbi:MAG: type II toxin-antitoxin system RelE/ParE family toxin [Selenomonadaceae bacterium]|nr:type II toxin-antitoxin system RelE/ParE family toxin [Selenomonadaceae bacterium]